MRSFIGIPVSLTCLFLSAYSSDPNMPEEKLQVPAPDWTNDLQVERVSVTRCWMRHDGEMFYVARNGSDIGDGLTARHRMNSCYVKDEQGVECHWNGREQLDRCVETNPAYTAYVAHHK